MGGREVIKLMIKKYELLSQVIYVIIFDETKKGELYAIIFEVLSVI